MLYSLRQTQSIHINFQNFYHQLGSNSHDQRAVIIETKINALKFRVLNSLCRQLISNAISCTHLIKKVPGVQFSINNYRRCFFADIRVSLYLTHGGKTFTLIFRGWFLPEALSHKWRNIFQEIFCYFETLSSQFHKQQVLFNTLLEILKTFSNINVRQL